MKKFTRKEARAWLTPIRRCFGQMVEGEVDSIRGYAVTRLHDNDSFERTDWCIHGFVGLLNRLLPDLDTAPMQNIQRKLANGVMLTVPEIEAGYIVLKKTEDALVGLPRQTIKDAVLVEQIQIEIDQQGIA